MGLQGRGHGRFINRRRVKVPAPDPQGDGSDGVHHFLPRTVVHGQAQGHAGAVAGLVLGAVELGEHRGGQSLAAANAAEPNVVRQHHLPFQLQLMTGQLHERRDFVFWSFPILTGE